MNAVVTQAAWAQTAIPVAPEDVTKDMLTIGQLVERTGLTVKTINAAISHPRDHANRRAPLRAIAQPKWCVGGGEPRWSSAQSAEYHRVRSEMQSTARAWAHLPRVTVEDAVRYQLASLTGLGERTAEVGKSNLARWKRHEKFPLPVARIDSGPTPKLLYVWNYTSTLDVLLREHLPEGVEDPEAWLTEALTQLSVAEWLRQHNAIWVADHPEIDLMTLVTEP